MPAHRKTTQAQILQMVAYLETQKDIQLGIVQQKTLNNNEAQHWEKIALLLNRLPGEKRTAIRWRSFWNNLKWSLRKKVMQCGGSEETLEPWEKRVLTLVGKVVPKRPVYVFPSEDIKVRLPQDVKMEQHTEENNSDSNEGEEQCKADKEIPENQENSMPDRMTNDEAVTEIQSDQEEEIQNVEEGSTVPEWVRRVEQNRLGLEERTTVAIEEISSSIATMAEAMQSIVASLQSVEASVRLSTARILKRRHSCDVEGSSTER